MTSVSSSLRRPLGGRCVSISLLLSVLSYRYCLLCWDERQFFIEKAIGWALRQYFLTTWCVVLQVLPAVLWRASVFFIEKAIGWALRQYFLTTWCIVLQVLPAVLWRASVLHWEGHCVGAAPVFPYYLVCCPNGTACCAVTSVSSSLRRPLGGRCVSISLLLGVLSYRYCLLCCDERQFFIEKAIGWALCQYFLTTWCVVLQVLPAVLWRASVIHWEGYWVGAASVFPYYLVCCPTGIACCGVTSVSSLLRRLLGGSCVSISLLLGVLSYMYCLLCCDERQFSIEKAIGWALRQYFLTTWWVILTTWCVVPQVLPAVMWRASVLHWEGYWVGAASVFPYYLVCCPTGTACCAVTSVSSSLRRPLRGRCVSISLLLGVLAFRYCLLCCDERQFFIEKAIGWALHQYSLTTSCVVLQVLPAVLWRASVLHWEGYWVGAASVFPYYLVYCPTGTACCAVTSVSSSLRRLLGGRCVSISLLLGVLSYRYCLLCCDERRFFIEKAIGWALRQYFLTTWCVVLAVYRYCRLCCDERQFFIEKAIGWALRQYFLTTWSVVLGVYRYCLLCCDERQFFIEKAIGWALRQYFLTTWCVDRYCLLCCDERQFFIEKAIGVGAAPVFPYYLVCCPTGTACCAVTSVSSSLRRPLGGRCTSISLLLGVLSYRYCLLCCDERQFFIEKAIGWALRQYFLTTWCVVLQVLPAVLWRASVLHWEGYWVGAASVFPYYLVCCPTGIACCAVTSVEGHWVGAAPVFPYYFVCCPPGIACCAVTSVSSSLRRPLGGRCVSISLLLGVLSYRYCLLCCDERQFFIEKAIGCALREYFLTTWCVVLQVLPAVLWRASVLHWEGYWVGAASVFPYYLVCCPTGIACCAVTSVSSSLRRLLGGRCISIPLLLRVLSSRYCLLCCDERQFFIEKAIGWALRQYFLTTWCIVLQVLPVVLWRASVLHWEGHWVGAASVFPYYLVCCHPGIACCAVTSVGSSLRKPSGGRCVSISLLLGVLS